MSQGPVAAATASPASLRSSEPDAAQAPALNETSSSALGRLLPERLGRSFAGLRRDLRMLADGLAGRHPAPYSLRKPRRGATGASLLSPRAVRVVEVIRETADAVTLVLAQASGEPFVYSAGQFFTLLVPAQNPTEPPLRRAYSASSSPLDGQTVSLTSKRVAGGVVSNYLNDAVQPGMMLKLLGPSGSFTPEPRPERRRHLVLIGGGSGITPLLSILRTVLRVETASRVSLIYGNRGLADIIFRTELEALLAQHGDRFALRHVLLQPPAGFTGTAGLLDKPTVAAEVAAVLAGSPSELPTEFYVCGPDAMMEAAVAALRDRGVPESAIHEERFLSVHARPVAQPAAPQPLEVTTPAGTRTLVVAPGQTILEAGLAAGVAMPFSCALGGCGACKVRLVRGTVAMSEPNCLSRAERESGAVLACIAKPESAVAIVVEPS